MQDRYNAFYCAKYVHIFYLLFSSSSSLIFLLSFFVCAYLRSLVSLLFTFFFFTFLLSWFLFLLSILLLYLFLRSLLILHFFFLLSYLLYYYFYSIFILPLIFYICSSTSHQVTSFIFYFMLYSLFSYIINFVCVCVCVCVCVRYQGRRLQWAHAHQRCVLTARFSKGKKELEVSLFQVCACVLNLFLITCLICMLYFMFMFNVHVCLMFIQDILCFKWILNIFLLISFYMYFVFYDYVSYLYLNYYLIRSILILIIYQ